MENNNEKFNSVLAYKGFIDVCFRHEERRNDLIASPNVVKEEHYNTVLTLPADEFERPFSIYTWLLNDGSASVPRAIRELDVINVSFIEANTSLAFILIHPKHMKCKGFLECVKEEEIQYLGGFPLALVPLTKDFYSRSVKPRKEF